MDPADALAELKRISSQIDRAVIVRGDALEAATVADVEVARRMAAAARRLWSAADDARGERPALVQVEVGAPDGSVFAVRDGELLIAATTAPDPSVGLVLYDLKMCLRSIAAGVDDPAETAAGSEGGTA